MGVVSPNIHFTAGLLYPTNPPPPPPLPNVKSTNNQRTMFRPSLRRLLAPRILATRLHPLLRQLPRPLLLPPALSPRSLSSTPPARVKSENHFPKELYESIAEGTLEGILMSLEILSEQREDIDVEYSVLLLLLLPLSDPSNPALTLP